MENCVMGKKILIIEDSKRDYMDILKCLPESFIPEHYTTICNDEIAALKNSTYILCICDKLMVNNLLQRRVDFDSEIIDDTFRRGVKRLSKLRQHLDCPLIIITKTPIRHIINFFEKLIAIDDPDVKAIFDKDHRILLQKLNANKCMPFGVVYVSEKVHIVIKPYSAKSPLDDAEVKWKKDFTKLLYKLCLLS